MNKAVVNSLPRNTFLSVFRLFVCFKVGAEKQIVMSKEKQKDQSC